MGNGQHRNRRGARPRALPHKHGGAGNTGRATTQLIPPIAPASAASVSVSPDESAGEDGGEWASEPALPATSGASGSLVLALDAGALQDASAPAPEESHQQRQHDDAKRTPQPALIEAATPLASHEEAAATEGAEQASQSVPPVSRGRFERFYAPGQGARGERVERVAPPIAPALPAVSAPPASHRRAERVPSVSEPLDEDDGAEYTGPRGDVRGSAGPLIDALHEVFVRDRSIASQGGVARCGVCYLHFPTGELTYRDADGFYVCQSCAHALGHSRVPMVRRQQRQ